MTAIEVRCDRRPGDGWACAVTLRDDRRTVSEHAVGVSTAALGRLAPGDQDPTRLVRASFEFLLEREAASSILRTFDIDVIGRYFPDYESVIRGRTGAR
jgi:hypothetical protein